MEMQSFSVNTSSHQQFVDVTHLVREAVEDSGISDGIAVVFVPHTTAGVTINENADPSVQRDIIAVLEKVVPWRDGYHHSEGNSAAHVRASCMGSSCHVIIENGQLQLGTWQGIYFAEFDGPRSRKMWVQVQTS
jgi:secondary thiamine-phosphate synthase enzyme